ncbi:MAG: PIG-L family deacetylase [Acidipila sp.]|nr:PIG-L family deacetylase [Acidipila sp.]
MTASLMLSITRNFTRKTFAIFFLLALALGCASRTQAQSLPDTVEAIDRARVSTRILYITAHPDDESSRVLTYLARGLGADVALLSVTRGEGGQNALGPEQGAQLGLLRTDELLAATRIYGVRLFYTRAPDLGYSKTVEETQRIWAGTAFDDMVRVIRTFRPHIVINNWGGVSSGHGHHQTTGIITPQAVAAAADPKMFNAQLADGLSPWQVQTVLVFDRDDHPHGVRLPVEEISPLQGKSYTEIGLEGFLNHRTQGIAGVLNNPFFRRPVYVKNADGSDFASKSLAQPITALAGSSIPRAPLESAERSLARARAAALALDWPSAAKALAAAGTDVRALSKGLASSAGPQSAYELARIKENIDAALALTAALRLDAQADRREIVAGESFNVRLEPKHRENVLDRIDKPALALPAGWTANVQPDDPQGAIFVVHTPAAAVTPQGKADWMFPWPPPLVVAKQRAAVAGYEFEAEAPAVMTQATSTHVEIAPLTLVPAVTLHVEPRQFLLVEKSAPKQIAILARVHYYGSQPADVTAGIDVPPGWSSAVPASLHFDGPGDQLVRLTISLPATIPLGSLPLQATATLGGKIFRDSVEPLPTLPARLWTEPAVTFARVLDLRVPENLRVGYVAGENDPIPEILRQIGVQVEMLDPAALAFGDLNRFDAIAIGIRAYELRADLARSNQRLLDFAAAGGTLVVQYQRATDWQRVKPAPFPATVGAPTVRTTDRNSPVRLLNPEHPLFTFPNRIGQDDFRGWVQERGLYYFSQFDARYEAPLGLRDPGEDEVTGGLVYARTGKGFYIYTGLAFFRQLPEGVPGAVRLFVNLLSQSRNK